MGLEFTVSAARGVLLPPLRSEGPGHPSPTYKVRKLRPREVPLPAVVWGPTEDTGCWPALSGASGLRGDERGKAPRVSYGEPGAHFVGICWRGHLGFKDQGISAALRAGPLPSTLSPGEQPLPSFENSF